MATPLNLSSSTSSGSSPADSNHKALPSSADPRAKLLFQQAIQESSRAAWAAAENNLRLALTYVPGNAYLEAMLREVVALRESERKASSHFRIS